MTDKMMTTTDDEFTRLKKPHFSPVEEEQGNAFNTREEEIGLLDIVLLDGLLKSDVCNH